MFPNTYLRRLIVPLIFEVLLGMTVGMVDTMMISSAGEAAVSGVSLVDMINNLILAILSALATGGAVVTGQLLGAKRKQEACLAANQLCYTAVLFGAALAGISILLRRPLLRLLFGSIEEDVMSNALIYLTITSLSFPMLGLSNACSALFRSMGNSRITLKVSLAMNIVNVAGNAVGIFVLHLGVAGVALPSLLSRTLSAAFMLHSLRRSRGDIRLVREKPHFDFSIIRKILYIGVPSGLENGFFQLGRLLLVSVIALFGTTQIAANGVANGVDYFSILIGSAMNLAMISVIGQCVGTGDVRQVRHYTAKLMKITYIGQWILDASLYLLLDPILSLYGLSEEGRQLARTLITIHVAGAAVLWPIAFTLAHMLRSCNDVRYTMIVSIISMLVFRIGTGVLLGIRFQMGALGVWIGMIADWVFRGSLFVWRYFHGDWQKHMGRLLKKEA